VGNLINCVLEADEEFLCMDFHFTLRDGGMRATFQLLHMVLEVFIFLSHLSVHGFMFHVSVRQCFQLLIWLMMLNLEFLCRPE